MQLDNPQTLLTPHGAGLSRALVPVTGIRDLVNQELTQDASVPNNSLTRDAAKLVNVRNVSPSQMVETSLDLYAMGLISFDDYSALAYHPELHPSFDRTIGALTGEAAAPERKRDYVYEWEQKNRFLRRHSPKNKFLIQQSERIGKMLSSLARLANLRV
jgi:hypothetical protein